MSSEHVEDVSVRECQNLLDHTIHNLRTPLRDIATSAALLSEAWREQFEEESKVLMDRILRGTAQLDNLAASLADYSMAMTREDPLPVPISTEAALDRAVASLQKQIRETGATLRHGTLPKLRARHDQLTVLFACLIKNALDFRGAAPPEIEVMAAREGSYWRFTVRDNGIGVEAEYREKVFQPFQRLHAGRLGNGLGLAISRKIVQSHGGRIWVEPNLKSGSTFVFTLPAGDRDV